MASLSPPSAFRKPAAAALTVLLYAPEETQAHEMTARLSPHVRLHWESSRTTSVANLMAADHDWQIVLLDFSAANAQHAADLARQLLIHAPALPLVAIGSPHRDGAGSVLWAMRAGVRDFVDLDASSQEILSVLRKSLTAGAPPLRAMPDTAAIDESGSCRSIMLMGVRAGVGTSTLAAHLAALSAAPQSRADAATEDDARSNDALIVDLGVPAADCALYLDLHGEFHFDDALAAIDRFDATLARTTLPRHASGAAVLARKPGAAIEAASPSATDALFARLCRIFKVVICDTGGAPAAEMPHDLMNRVDEIWLVTDASVSAMIALGHAIETLKRLDALDADAGNPRVHLIVNRHVDDGGITPDQIAQRFSLPLLAALPERGRPMRATSSLGQLMHDQYPLDPYVKALQPLIARLRADAPAFPASTSSKWLAGLKAMSWKKAT